MGAQLVRHGDDDFVIVEKSAALGVVWRDNAYPGAACDTEAHLYCYSFFPHLRVSRMYAGREELLGYLQRLADQVSDPQLRARLTLEDYEFGCKRTLRSDDFYPALCRPNVSLELRPIAGFHEHGILTADGEALPFDVVIFGTGFASQAFQGELAVHGRAGATLERAWQADMGGSAFSSGCSSWYKNTSGRVINNWSGTVVQYRAAAQWKAADYHWL